ncbi:MAG: methyltransferase domain-containing protein [Acetobacteraceae bacterium]|nr:methyltransferase domain-containing protein [Acetobacteraceae bacterium]
MPTLKAAYFDSLYAGKADPWDFAASPYEAAKYAATLAALPRHCYLSALEIGCSIGVLTAGLASRCDALLAVDIAEAALVQARVRNAGQRHVRFALGQFPDALPANAAGYDLIMLSEVLYYLDMPTLLAAAQVTLEQARTGADIMLVHWLGPTPDYPLTGDAAAEAFIAALRPGVEVVLQRREENYRIDLMRR